MSYDVVIGLEVHAQLNTRTKLFCGCSTSYGAPPNTQTCAVCLGHPGALPVPNGQAVALALRAGFSLGCEINAASRFARKNYFYPDLAKGYQISQFAHPVCTGGEVRFEVEGEMNAVTLERIHIEEDAAKNLHGMEGRTVVDFNRGGVPLIEIVSRPELRSAAAAEAYLRRLREVLMFAGVNDGNLEEGSFRCDANVSIRPDPSAPLGTRVEIKNVNSFRFVRKAIEHEVRRQESVLRAGEKVVQETRSWDEHSESTFSMRGKEEAHDYRYFPDPDLPPLRLTDDFIAEVRRALPTSADARREEWVTHWGLTAYDADVLSGHPGLAQYVQDAAQDLCDLVKCPKNEAGKRVANFVQAEALRDVELQGLDFSAPVSATRLAQLLTLVADGTISGKIAKEVYVALRSDDRPPLEIVDERGLAQVTDTGAIEAVVLEVIAANSAQAEAYRGGKTKMLGYFVGQVMKATGGKANPQVVNELLKQHLETT